MPGGCTVWVSPPICLGGVLSISGGSTGPSSSCSVSMGSGCTPSMRRSFMLGASGVGYDLRLGFRGLWFRGVIPFVLMLLAAIRLRSSPSASFCPLGSTAVCSCNLPGWARVVTANPDTSWAASLGSFWTHGSAVAQRAMASSYALSRGLR